MSAATTVASTPPAPADPPAPARGMLHWIILSACGGLALVAGADALSRTGQRGGDVLFWLGCALIIVPAALRMFDRRPSSTERAATVVVIGLALYGVKVLRDPFAFTYADEFAHFHNLQSILSTGRLFGSNSILPITARYPGLESVAAALARLGGISPFSAGIVLIAVARVVLMLALYLFFERVSGSGRAAGLGALVFTATPNFLLWLSQFSYESLALPLGAVALFTLMCWGQATARSTRRRWTITLLLVGIAIVPTHHVTAYALVAFLLGLCLLHRQMYGRREAPWALTALLGVFAISWFIFAATGTLGYLGPVLTKAFNQVVSTLNGQASTRVLFANQGGAEQTPRPEEALAIAGILALILAIAGGVRVVWRQGRSSPLLLLLVTAAVVYVGTLPLRFVPAAWETAARTGEFLFVGVALTAALGLMWLLGRAGRPVRFRAQIAAAAIMFVFASGVIAGWPATLRLALPLVVRAGGRTLQPPEYMAARWMGAHLGTQRVAAADSDARVAVDYGHQVAIAGSNPDVSGMLSARTLAPWRPLLRQNRFTVVETDRRVVSTDVIAGYFFNFGSVSLTAPVETGKFNVAAADLLYSSGYINIYWVRGLW